MSTGQGEGAGCGGGGVGASRGGGGVGALRIWCTGPRPLCAALWILIWFDALIPQGSGTQGPDQDRHSAQTPGGTTSEYRVGRGGVGCG